MKLNRLDIQRSRNGCTELANQPRIEFTRDPDRPVVKHDAIRLSWHMARRTSGAMFVLQPVPDQGRYEANERKR